MADNAEPTRYDHEEVETRWQRWWLEHRTYRAEPACDKPKYYALDMFPYPSGAGLHVGHPEGYTATDIISRQRRMKGFNVLHPMGWDAFGLPAEQHALATGTHPRENTQQNIANFKRQIIRLGLGYDWQREVDTTDPGYYRFTQWIFLKLFERGLAYQAEVPVNWCPALGTVLANEEVIDGLSERGGHPVIRKPMRQWMLKITEYAERLLADLEELDWPESIKAMQRNWIGRSEGAEVDFAIPEVPEAIRIYTTRPDTLFGATYMVLAPEHPAVERITTDAQREAVDAYRERAARKSELERSELQKEKTGVFTGAYAVNPVNDARIPVWIADYVLLSYGTGAIMAVPGHDERDWEFARAFDLPIVCVVANEDGTEPDLSEAAFPGEGVAVRSGDFDGLRTPEFKKQITEWLERKGLGKKAVNYRLRDWLFSRQRYWGEPIPVIHLEDGRIKPLPYDSLPLTLPEIDSIQPSGTGESPLAVVTDWVDTTDPETGAPARRETNTMPQWAGSCWYYLRYLSPDYTGGPVDPEQERYWMPVDLYVGGAEHAVLHLLYARFWHKVLFDAGVVSTKEPFQRLVNQGMILGEVEYTRFIDEETGASVSPRHVDKRDGARFDKRNGRSVRAERVEESDVEKRGDAFVLVSDPSVDVEARAHKMSKSLGNVINPDDIVAAHGADALRLYEMFMGPLEATKPWATKDIVGISRFLDRVWRLGALEVEDGEGSDAVRRATHRAAAKVTEDIEGLRFNTAISALMVLSTELSRQDRLPRASFETFLRLLSPFAPHIAEELWSRLGNPPSIAHAEWPGWDEALLVDAVIEVPIQVNGKVRARESVPRDLGPKDLEAAVLANERVQALLEGREVKKVIVVPGRLVNIVVK